MYIDHIHFYFPLAAYIAIKFVSFSNIYIYIYDTCTAPTEFSQCQSYIHECRDDHQVMRNLSGDLSLKKMVSPSLSSFCLHIMPQLGVGLCVIHLTL